MTFHAVGQSLEKCQDKLATLAGLHVGQDHSPPNPAHTVPASHLQCIWKTFNERYKTIDGDEDYQLEPSELIKFAMAVRRASKTVIPPYWLADTKTMGRIVRNFKSTRYDVDHLDKVRRSIMDDRDPLAQSNGPTQYRFQFTRNGMSTEEVKEAINFARWMQALWIYTMTTWYILTALYSTELKPFIDLSHCFDLLAKFDQFVVHAPLTDRIPFKQAKYIYFELLTKMYILMRDENYTWSEAYAHHSAWLDTKFCYVAAPIVVQKEAPRRERTPRRDRSKTPRRRAPKTKPTLTPSPGVQKTIGKYDPDKKKIPKGYKRKPNSPFWLSRDDKEFCFLKNCLKTCPGNCGRIHECNWMFCTSPKTCPGSKSHRDLFSKKD